MEFNVKRIAAMFRTASILPVICFCFSGYAGAAPFSGAQLQSFRSALDSLEVALEARTRAGLQADSLEEKIALCRDSIAVYRHLEKNGSEALLPDAHMAGAGKISLLWILDVKAGIADLAALLGVGHPGSHPFMVLFSGPTLAAMLLLGFILVVLSLARRRLKVGGLRAASRRAAVFYDSARPVAAPPPAAQAHCLNDDNEPLELFAPVEISSDQPVPPPENGDAGDEPRGVSQTIEALIVSANEEGLSVREISRRYHVSVDQVGLAMALVKNR